MILLSITFHKTASKIFAYPVKVKMQPLIHFLREDLFSVFRHKDQMQVKVVNNMSFCA